MKYQPRTKPFKHQSKMTLAMVRKKNIAVLGDPGVGKTKACLDAVAMLALKGEVSRVAVFCPLIAIGVWEDEIEKHFPFKAECQTHDEEWVVGERTVTDEMVEFYFMNYDKASRRIKKRKYHYPYLEEIETFRPDLIVLDESHRVKRASSNRAQAIWRLVERLRANGNGRPYVALMTGTPNPKGYLDLFAQFRIMDQSIFGTTKSGFEDSYCVYGYGKRRFTVVKYRNKEDLLKRVRQHSVIVPESASDLPPRMFQNVRVTLPTDVRRAYVELADEMLTEIEGEILTGANSGAVRVRLLQLTGGFTTDGRRLHSSKLLALTDLASSLYEQGQPLVVYARFLQEVSAISEALAKVGFDVAAITGSTPHRDRTAAIRKYQSHVSDSPRALVFQVETGSLSITLTRGREVLFYSLPDSWSTYYQAYKRVHRTGQHQSVRIRHLICPGTVDVSILAILRKKADMHSEMMGSPRDFLFGV